MIMKYGCFVAVVAAVAPTASSSSSLLATAASSSATAQGLGGRQYTGPSSLEAHRCENILPSRADNDDALLLSDEASSGGRDLSFPHEQGGGNHAGGIALNASEITCSDDATSSTCADLVDSDLDSDLAEVVVSSVSVTLINDRKYGVDVYYSVEDDQDDGGSTVTELVAYVPAKSHGEVVVAQQAVDASYGGNGNANAEFLFASLDGRRFSYRIGRNETQFTIALSALTPLTEEDGNGNGHGGGLKRADDLMMDVHNDLDREVVELFWVDGDKGGDWYSAPLVSVGRIAPGDTLEVETFGGHHFVLSEEDDDVGLSKEWEGNIPRSYYHLPIPLDASSARHERHKVSVSQIAYTESDVPVTITFYNDANAPVDVVWWDEENEDFDERGGSIEQGRMDPGERRDIETHSGHTLIFQNDIHHLVFRVPVIAGKKRNKTRIQLSSLVDSTVEYFTPAKWLAKNGGDANNAPGAVGSRKAALPRYLDYRIRYDYTDPRDGAEYWDELWVRRYTGESTPYSFPVRSVPLSIEWPSPSIMGDDGRRRPAHPFTDDDFFRDDETDDLTSYYGDGGRPHFQYYSDEPSIAALTEFYRRAIPQDSDILDVGSSWTSHYPLNFPAVMERIAGIGLNGAEMVENDQLTDYLDWDLNAGVESTLPYPDETFDVVTCASSVEYLVRPIEVLREMGRVLKPGGKVIVAVSNRVAFPSKATQIWFGMRNDRERLELINGFIRYAGGFKATKAFDITAEGRGSSEFDSVFILQAVKA